jgi:hypothetical protein
MKYESPIEALRKRPHYEDLIDMIQFKQPKIKYPNRVATFMRNSPYLSQFDGDSWIDLEEQENNILKDKLIQEAIRNMASQKGMTHASLQARAGIYTPSFPPPSDYDSADSDFTGYADSEVQRREVQKRARYTLMAERAKQNLREHVKQTAKGIFDTDSEADYYSEDENIPAKVNLGDIKKGIREKHVKEILNDVVENVFKQSKGPEQASSSSYQAVYPTGLNPAPLPKKTRSRSTTRPGTQREGNDPEGVPRRIRAKSQPPIKTIPEAKPKGRPRGSTNKPK